MFQGLDNSAISSYPVETLNIWMPTCMIRNIRHIHGNALFIVLVAIGLFAALSYAVSSSFRGGVNTISEEQARVSAGNLIRGMNTIKEGYLYLWNQKGCSIDEISFASPGKDVSGTVFDAKTPRADNSCDVFHPGGASIAYPANLQQYQGLMTTGMAAYSGKLAFSYAKTPSFTGHAVGTAAADHAILLYGVEDKICKSVNRMLKIQVGETIPALTDTSFAGEETGCFKHSPGTNVVFMVILPL